MQEMTIVTSSIWDCESARRSLVAFPTPAPHALTFSIANSPAMTETSNTSTTAVDDLPPFASLTTDEDREKKAERSSPGTYNVVVNQDSFQHLPEYGDDGDVKKEFLSPLRRGSLATSLSSGLGRDQASEPAPASTDPNIVVLPRFEDVARRTTFGSTISRPHLSPLLKQNPFKLEDSEEAVITEEPEKMDTTQSTSQEAIYSRQFRHVVWRQIVPAELGQRDGMLGSSVHVLESAAASFTPVGDTFLCACLLTDLGQLFHAMMAVSAFSLSSNDGNARLDALQHYQQALPALQSSLKSPEDLSSDGAFLTHFLLLIYEVRLAAQPS